MDWELLRAENKPTDIATLYILFLSGLMLLDFCTLFWIKEQLLAHYRDKDIIKSGKLCKINQIKRHMQIELYTGRNISCVFQLL